MSHGNTANREFTYTPRWGVMIAGAVFFGICGLVSRAQADSNDRGLIINGIIELSSSSATIFYWVLTWMSFASVAIAALMLVVRVLNPQKLVFAESGLYAPEVGLVAHSHFYRLPKYRRRPHRSRSVGKSS